MRAAHFSFEYPPSTTGGLGSYLEALVRHQREAGDRVDVFFLGDDPPPDGTLPLPFYRQGRLLNYGPGHLRRLSGTVDYDVAVCHDWAGALVSEPLWRRAIPVAMTCHLPLAEDIGYYPDLPCDFAAEMEFFAVARSERILAVSEATRELLAAQYPFARERIAVVHNGTDTGFFTPGEAGGGFGDGCMVAFVGRFAEQKGFLLLPEILRAIHERVPEVRLRIAGTGPLLEAFRERVLRLGLGERVELSGFLDRAGVRALYRQARAVLMPSLGEPFGLVAVESMATETPVIAAAVGGLTEIIRHGQDGLLVPPGDIADFAEAAAFLLRHRDAARALGAAARRTVLARFDERRCFERTRRAYARLAAGEGAGARWRR